MNRTCVILLGFAILLAGLRQTHAESKEAKLSSEVKEAIVHFHKMDSGLAKFFETAHGYVVFPKVAKGAAGIGAAHGTGQVFEKGKLIGESKLTQVTLGLQLGGQVYAEVVFFETQESLDRFKSGKFALSAQASAVAAAEGASANAKYEQGVAIFTLSQGGLMFEASVGGQKFSFKPAP
ncbi:MAG TPA: YSC84-related protein [Candidatus Paceibacterota bacterium]|nr:YSC84-related protein [Verrucomicrobiota bacterium]HRY47937.1 YSC84-related protein [Candidatus Paceibacterota bacterium]HSA03623.1 YSC84-related protein [Candidatus Paceibacterota bacterium]